MVALIGNGNVQRDKLVLHTLDVIKKSVPANWEIVHRCISWQPSGARLAIGVRFARIFAVARAIYAWEFHRRMVPRFSGFIGFPYAVLTSTAYLVSQVFKWRKAGESGFKHIQLTRKHIHAWEGFLNSDFDYLICLEDDAFPLADCEGKLRTVFERLPGSDQFLYSLLSRGVNQVLLRFPTQEVSPRSGILFEPIVPHTNTTAGYLVTRKMAEGFLAEMQASPSSSLVNIDFLINFLFSRIKGRGGYPRLICWHFSEPPIDNASMSSQLGSTIS